MQIDGRKIAAADSRSSLDAFDLLELQRIVKILAEADRIMKEIELPLDRRP